MSLISMKFVLFTGIAVGGYYLIPKKAQWVWLLVASYVYYLSAGAGVVFHSRFLPGSAVDGKPVKNE